MLLLLILPLGGLAGFGQPQADPNKVLPAASARDVAPLLPPGAIRRIGEDRFHHDDFVCDLALAADGLTAYTVAGKAAYAWHLETGRLKWRTDDIRNPGSQRARIVEAGDRVIVAPHDLPGPVYAFDRTTGRQLGHWPKGDGPAEMWARVSPGERRRYVIVGADASPPREREATFRDLGGEANSITVRSNHAPWSYAVSQNGKTVALNLYWSNTLLYDTRSGKRTGNVKDADPDESVTPLAFSPDGRTLVTTCWNRGNMGVDARDVAKGSVRRLADSRWSSGATVPYTARFTPNGKLLAIDDGRTWEIHDFASNRLLYAVPASRYQFQCGLGEFTSDSKRFVGLRDPYRLIVYDATTGKAVGPPVLPGHVSRLEWTADGRLVALGNRAVATWDPQTGRRTSWSTLPPDMDGEEPAADLSAAGDRVAYLTHRHASAAIFDLHAGTTQQFEKRRNRRASIEISPDGSHVSVINGDGFQVIDTSTGKVVRTLTDRKLWDNVGKFTPDSRKLVCVIDDGVSVWDMTTGRETRMGGEKVERATCLAALPGNRYAVAGLQVFDGREEKEWSYLSAWDIQSEKQVMLVDLKIAWPSRQVPLVGGSFLIQSFRPISLVGLTDGQRVAVGDSGGRVHVFEVLTGKLLRTLDSLPRNPANEIRAVAASPDGRYLASVCEGTILIWDLRAGKP